MKTNKPVLTLSMDEKIYLAVAKKDLDKLSFVYTLACFKNATTQYNMNATPEIHTFNSQKDAKVYHDTIEQIIDFYANDKTKEALFNMNENLIERFLENTK